MSKQNNKCKKCNGCGNLVCPQCNGSGSEPEAIFHTIYIHEWEQFLDYQGDLEVKSKREGKSWIFRGQSDATWPLETSIRRHCGYFPDSLKNPKKAEKILLREFRRRFHQYSTYIPSENDFLEWLSLMQHHGSPTRLLDFTYSMLIAAYFALETARGDCTVWAINASWASEKSGYWFKGSPEHDFFNEPITEKTTLHFKKIFLSDTPKQFVCPLNPFRLTQRITVQKGAFLCSGDITETFENNLCYMQGFNNEDNVKKFVISLSSDNWRKAVDCLYDLHITRTTLFPGLDGFASSLRVSPPKMMLSTKI